MAVGIDLERESADHLLEADDAADLAASGLSRIPRKDPLRTACRIPIIDPSLARSSPSVSRSRLRCSNTVPALIAAWQTGMTDASGTFIGFTMASPFG